MLRRSLIIAGAAGLSMFTIPSAQAQLIYDFDSPAGDDGQDLDGWTNTLGASVPVEGGRGASVGGGGGPGQEDGPHPNLVFSSPAFFLNGSGGDLTFQLRGGEGKGDVPATAFPSNLSTIPNAESTTDGIQIVGLRNATNNDYVIITQKPNEGNEWQPLSITAAQLAALDQNASYQFDLIETRHGGWGHTEIDDVSIPGTLVPEPTALSLLGAAGLLALRRRR